MFSCKNCKQSFGSYIEWSNHFIINYLKRSECSKYPEPITEIVPLEPKKILDIFADLYSTEIGRENFNLSTENNRLKKENELLKTKLKSISDSNIKNIVIGNCDPTVELLKDEIKYQSDKVTKLRKELQDFKIMVNNSEFKKIMDVSDLVEMISLLLGEEFNVETHNKYYKTYLKYKNNDNQMAEEIDIEIDPEIRNMSLEELLKNMTSKSGAAAVFTDSESDSNSEYERE